MSNNIKNNYILNLAYQILIILLPIITTPYVSRVLGAEGVGIYGYTVSITTYFILFGCIGLGLYGQREVAFHQKNKMERSKVFYELLLLKAIAMTLSIFIFFATINVIDQYKIIFYIQVIDLIANILDITFLYQGLEEFKKIVIRNVTIKLISIISIFMFVKTTDDLPLYVAIYSISLLAGNLSMWIHVSKYICRVPIKSLQISKHIKPTLLLFLPQIAISIYTVLDRTMIGMITNNVVEIGYYEQAQKIVKLALTVVTSLGIVMLPRIANLFAEDNNEKIKHYIELSLRFVFLIGFPIMFGLIGIATNLIPWFLGDEFSPSMRLLAITSPIIIFIGISNVIGLQLLIPTKRQKAYTFSTILGSLINFGLNLILIPILLSTGATIASVIAEFVVASFQIICVRKEIDFMKVIRNSLKYFVSAFIMLLILLFISPYLEAKIISSCILIAIGGIVYIFSLLILKDDYIVNTITQMKGKFKI